MKKALIILFILLPIALYSAPIKKTATKKRVIERLEKGSFYQAAIGGGVSSLQYDLLGGQNHLMPSLNLQFGYTYYFNKYVGITTGLQYTTYATRSVLKDPLQWNGLTDYMGDNYNHIISFHKWQERQAIHSLEIPLGVALKYKPHKVGLYTNLGIKMGIAADQHYKNSRGTISHSAYYPLWNVTIENLPDRFETEDYTSVANSLNNLHRVNGLGYFDIGALIELNPHTDLTIGAYANVYINNAARFKADDRIELGFANRLNNYGSFMNTYSGIIGTQSAGSVVRPWSAGVKVGISITPQRTDKEKERKAKQMYRKYKRYLPPCPTDTVIIYIRDTIIDQSTRLSVRDTIFIHDTIQSNDLSTNQFSNLTQQQSKQLDSLLSGAIIWFHFDEYVPILQPVYILDSVANMLLTNSELRVHINGHACSIGSDSYNQRLALKRAQAVAGLLEKKGVKQSQLIVASFGATEPFRYNGKHQLSTDRRVEIIPEIYGNKNITIQAAKTDGKTSLYSKFIGEEKITEGMRLSLLARKWYGHREYWVYIYEANADKIDSPNDLPIGITIMIPDLKASLADSSETEMLRRAKQLEAAYKEAQQ